MTETSTTDVSTPPDPRGESHGPPTDTDPLAGRTADGELTAASRGVDPVRPVGQHRAGGQ